MVDFEAEVYNKQDNNITGIRVLVKSDVGDVIGTAEITDELELDNLRNQIAECVTPTELNTVLANAGGTSVINASTLAGHDGDYFAEANHSHDADAINGLYKYDIYMDNYNPEMGTRGNYVYVKVEEYGGTRVSNKLVSIKRDGQPWASGMRTNTNGIAKSEFVADTPGITTFTCDDARVQCNVKDAWKQVPLLKTVPFECNLYILESQKLANLVMYIPRYVGWCKTTNTAGMKPDEIDPASIRFISENKDAVSDSARKYLFNGTNTEYVLPLEYCPTRTISQPLYKSNYVVYLHRDGSLSGMAREYSTNSNNVNWSVDVHFNQVWRYGNEE